MKFIIKMKDGTEKEISMEEAVALFKSKKATIDPVKCETEKTVDAEGKEVLNIFVPNLKPFGKVYLPS